MSERESSSSAAPNGPAQTGEPSTTPEATSTNLVTRQGPESSSSSSAAPNGPAQTGEPSTTPEATSTKLGDKTMEAIIKLFDDIKTENRVLKDGEIFFSAMKSHLEPENKSDTESNAERKRWADARKEFVDKYRLKREDYQDFTEVVKKKCEKVLKKLEDIPDQEEIPHQELSSRAKKIDSVKDKISREIPVLRKKGNPTDAMTQLYDRIVDLAGVRILVYFPSDVSRVVEAIKYSGEFDIMDSVVSFSRRRVDYRDKDRSKQLEGADLNYTDGPWMEKQVSPDDIIHRWKNSGYRAAHLHVRLKSQGAIDVTITAQSKVPLLQLPLLLSLPQLHGGNELQEVGTCGDDNSEQNASSPGPDTKGKGKRMEPSPCPNVSSPGFEFPEEKIAEIQITTVVMHAWSQVEHDIIYKNPHSIPINDTMTRMLDGVNGLSINSEILLEELRQTRLEAQEEAKENDNKPFDEKTFPQFLQEEYLKKYDNWGAHPQWVSVLSKIARDRRIFGQYNYTGGITRGDKIATPAKLRNFVEEHGILKKNPKMWEKQDLAIALLKELGVQFRGDFLSLLLESVHEGIMAEELAIQWRFLVVANAFSIMVMIDGQTAIKEFNRKGIDHLRLINAVVLGFRLSKEERERFTLPKWWETPGSLLKFVDGFIEADSYETQKLAIALSSLQYYTVLFEIRSRGWLQRYKEQRCEDDFSYEKLQKDGDFHSVFFRSFFLRNNEAAFHESSCVPIKEGTPGTEHARHLVEFRDPSEVWHHRLGFRSLLWGDPIPGKIQYERLECFKPDELKYWLVDMDVSLARSLCSVKHRSCWQTWRRWRLWRLELLKAQISKVAKRLLWWSEEGFSFIFSFKIARGYVQVLNRAARF